MKITIEAAIPAESKNQIFAQMLMELFGGVKGRGGVDIKVEDGKIYAWELQDHHKGDYGWEEKRKATEKEQAAFTLFEIMFRDRE